MSSELLAILALLQAGVLVLLFTVLFWKRVARTHWEKKDQESYEELRAALGRWRRGEDDASSIRRALDGSPLRSARRFLDDVGEELEPDARGRLRAVMRDTAWFDSVCSSATRSWFWWRRMDAAQILRFLGTGAEAELLADLLRDRHGATRLAAMFAARALRLPELLPTLFDRLLEEERPRRKVLVDSLLAYGEELAEPLLGRFDATDDPADLQILLTVLGRLARTHPLPAVRERLLPLTSHRDTEVRIQAVRAMRAFDDEAAVRAVEAALSDEAWEVRTQAATALGAMGGGDRVREALRGALGDPNWWVRLRAAIALRKQGDRGVRELESIEPREDRFAHDMANYVLSLTPRAVEEYAG